MFLVSQWCRRTRKTETDNSKPKRYNSCLYSFYINVRNLYINFIWTNISQSKGETYLLILINSVRNTRLRKMEMSSYIMLFIKKKNNRFNSPTKKYGIIKIWHWKIAEEEMFLLYGLGEYNLQKKITHIFSRVLMAAICTEMGKSMEPC